MARTGKPLKGPKGTRDVYPEDMLRRRYITQAWRDVSIRHGFEEIEGPTFETSELYAVKSGEGILGELFQAFSGKSPEEVAAVQETGRGPFAMRPEFTPTLARMYAARAKQLPKPCKWFSVGPYFRAERPQRGRLREFLQWNVDVVGGAGEAQDADVLEQAYQLARSDEECIGVSVDCLHELGAFKSYMHLRVNDRQMIEEVIKASLSTSSRDSSDALARVFALLDKKDKIGIERYHEEAERIGFSHRVFDSELVRVKSALGAAAVGSFSYTGTTDEEYVSAPAMRLATLLRYLGEHGYKQNIRPDSSIVRGLAYYTGMVFEVTALGERAVAGGGRYDNLIELLGGPPTPAVGFAMGDVVLSLLLEDKNLMPEGADLLDACSRPTASLRPEAFVISADEALDAEVRRLVATLRRGKESDAWLGRDGRKPWDADRYNAASEGVRPMHARRSYKATRKIPKLLQDAAGQHAKFAVIIENPEICTVQDLASGERNSVKLDQIPSTLIRLLGT